MHLIQIGCAKAVSVCTNNRNSQKVVDKIKGRWYTHKALKGGTPARRVGTEKTRKKFQKGIDKLGWRWYNIQAVGETAKLLENWTTRQRYFLNKEVEKTPKNSFEFIWTLIISKEPKTALREMLSGETRLIYNFSESLILAQDERWRRA